MRFDNRNQYISSHFIKSCEDHDIARQYIMPCNLNKIGFWNGKITLWLKLFTRTKLLHTLWAEAITIIGYIQDYCYITLIFDKTPIELWANMQPNLCHLCVSNALHMNMCQMRNDNNLTPKHKNAFLLTMGNSMVLKAIVYMIKPFANSL